MEDEDDDDDDDVGKEESGIIGEEEVFEDNAELAL